MNNDGMRNTRERPVARQYKRLGRAIEEKRRAQAPLSAPRSPSYCADCGNRVAFVPYVIDPCFETLRYLEVELKMPPLCGHCARLRGVTQIGLYVNKPEGAALHKCAAAASVQLEQLAQVIRERWYAERKAEGMTDQEIRELYGL